MTDLNIERLNLQIVGAPGHEHRIQTITAMAMAMIGEELVELGRNGSMKEPANVDAMAAPPTSLDMQRTDDAGCARAMADSVLKAIRLRAEG